MEATVLSCRFSWVWSAMPKVLWSNKSPVSLERVVWFCWFFGSINLHLVRYPLKLRKYDVLGWYCQAHPLSHSDCQLFWILKTQKGYEVSSWFFSSIETRRNIMPFWVLTPKHSWPISLQDILLLACLTCQT